MPTNRHTLQAQADLYAGTLIDALNNEGGVNAVVEAREQLSSILSYNRSHADLMTALKDAVSTPQDKAKLIKGVFSNCLPAVQSVLGVMAERDDMGTLSRVLDSFNRQIPEKLNMTVVDVVTCVPLDDHLREVITKKASADLGCKVVLHESVDPSILGGIIMSANGKRIDASIATLAEDARVALKKSN